MSTNSLTGQPAVPLRLEPRVTAAGIGRLAAALGMSSLALGAKVDTESLDASRTRETRSSRRSGTKLAKAAKNGRLGLIGGMRATR